MNSLLKETGIDRWAEGRCERFYAKEGRPGIPPGVYFRMLMIGYFERLDSERGIAWRCADSLGLREFLGYGLTEPTPDMFGKASTLPGNRQVCRTWSTSGSFGEAR